MATIRVLLVEDDEDDYFLTEECLEGMPARQVELEWVQTYEQGFARLEAGAADICFLDYRIGGSTGLDFLERVKARGLLTPVVLLTGVGQHDIDLAATEAGAADFLDKSELQPAMLERTIRYAIAHAEARQALAEKSSVLQMTLENAGAGIAAFNQDGHVTARNRRFDTMLATLGEDDDDETGLITDLLARCQAQEPILLTAGDRIYELNRNDMPHGGCVIVAVDVSTQKALEADMHRAKTEAEEATRAKSAFFSNIRHELRTPLHSIIGFSDLIRKGTDIVDPVECADFIHGSGLDLLGIIDSLLEYSLLESGCAVLRSDEIHDIDFIICSVIGKFHPEAAKRGIELSSSIAPDIDGLIGDEGALRRILGNLISNAVRFSDDSGRISVSMYADADAALQISVSDDGIGMTEEEVHRMLAPFEQADSDLNRCHEGIGMGLSLVRLLIDALGGELVIDTSPGCGTTVIVKLAPDSAIMKYSEFPDLVEEQIAS